MQLLTELGSALLVLPAVALLVLAAVRPLARRLRGKRRSDHKSQKD